MLSLHIYKATKRLGAASNVVFTYIATKGSLRDFSADEIISFNDPGG